MCGRVSLNEVEQRVDFGIELLERLPTDGTFLEAVIACYNQHFYFYLAEDFI